MVVLCRLTASPHAPLWGARACGAGVWEKKKLAFAPESRRGLPGMVLEGAGEIGR